NVLGAWVGSRLSRRLREPAAGFGVSLLCLGAFGILYVPWLCAWFFGTSDAVAPAFGPLLTTSGIHKAAGPVFHSVALFLAPSIAMGVGLPLALQAWVRVRHGVGATTGFVYGLNTIGAVLGGALTGFVLIPLLGVQLAVTALGLLAVGLGVALMLTTVRSLTYRAIVAALGLACILTAAFAPSHLFERKIIRMRGGEVITVREGTTTTVTVTRNDDGARIMAIDNIPMAGDGAHRSAQKMLGHLAPLLHGNAKTALSIGFGCGETTACLATHGLERIDCVEIAPEVVDAGIEFFSHINLGDRLHERVNVMALDGRTI
ncbi:hypothetical protein HQ560_19815, partial [bacterium]|nr:hypothetical protein [bacterium]